MQPVVQSLPQESGDEIPRRVPGLRKVQPVRARVLREVRNTGRARREQGRDALEHRGEEGMLPLLAVRETALQGLPESRAHKDLSRMRKLRAGESCNLQELRVRIRGSLGPRICFGQDDCWVSEALVLLHFYCGREGISVSDRKCCVPALPGGSDSGRASGACTFPGA